MENKSNRVLCEKKKNSPFRKPFIWLRNLYIWVLHWAETRYATPALFINAFVESSFFPVPPDVLLIALVMGRPKKAFYFATICTTGSVLGAFFGYFIGYELWKLLQPFFIPYIFSQETFDKVVKLYHENDFLAVFTAAFTPIPYKVFTIAGGVCKISLLSLFIASVFGRGGRFFIVSSLIFIFGPPIKKVIDKYFEVFAIAFTILLIGGFIVIEKIL